VAGTAIFHHLESAGRKNIAVSGDTVAVTWEDNRSGESQVYVAFKRPGEGRFGNPQKASAGKEAFEPTVAAMGEGAFVLAWEQDSRIRLRMVEPHEMGPAIRLGDADSVQASLAVAPEGTVRVAWSERRGRHRQIIVAALAIDPAGAPRIAAAPQAVDASGSGAQQQYPSLAVTGRNTMVVAWEDRRHGHTRLYVARSSDGRTFEAPRQLNEAVVAEPGDYGAGTGVMRVTLAATANDQVAAAWLDKRNPRYGYSVYGDLSLDDGRTFGPNDKIQDPSAGTTAQWHPSIAGHGSGLVVIAWDDARRGNPDIWLSWYDGDEWSADTAPPGASGADSESDPTVALDEAGNIHLAWIRRHPHNGPSRILYALGRATPP